jgi:hypothetical protein
MEGTVRLRDGFLKQVQLRITDLHGRVSSGIFIIEDDQRNCKLVHGEYVYHSIIQIINMAHQKSYVPFSHLHRELTEVSERGEILECKMGRMGRVCHAMKLEITDDKQRRLQNIRIIFGDKTDTYQTFSDLTDRSRNEKALMEQYNSEAQALYEKYKRLNSHLPLKIPNPQATFPPILSMGVSEYLGNHIDPRISFPPIPVDPSEPRPHYYHESAFGGGESSLEDRLVSDHSLEPKEGYSFMDDDHWLRSSHDSMPSL